MQAMKREREEILETELLMKGARISSPQKEGASNKLLFPTAFIRKPNDREDDEKWTPEKR